MVKGYRETDSLYRIRLNDVTTMEEREAEACGSRIRCTYVELGDPGIPHVVLEIPGLMIKDKEELRELGKTLRHHEIFPKGANVNFYDVIDNDNVSVLTYEKAEDFTWPAATGAYLCAVLTDKKLVSGDHVKVSVPGGELFITVSEDGLFLTGPTAIVAPEGTVNVKELLK